MGLRRHRSDFRPLARVSLREAGIPARRARALFLEHAWRRTAGPAMTKRVQVVRLSGGVLELRVADRRWVEPVRRLLRTVAARLAREFPELGVRRFRILSDESGPRRAETVRAAAEPPSRPGRVDSGPGSDAAGETEAASTTERLARAARRYLDRGRS